MLAGHWTLDIGCLGFWPSCPSFFSLLSHQIPFPTRAECSKNEADSFLGMLLALLFQRPERKLMTSQGLLVVLFLGWRQRLDTGGLLHPRCGVFARFGLVIGAAAKRSNSSYFFPLALGPSCPFTHPRHVFGFILLSFSRCPLRGPFFPVPWRRLLKTPTWVRGRIRQ